MSNDNRLTIINFSKPVKSAAKNFWRMLPYSKSEYTIFCDQDDIWLDTKLEELLCLAESEFSNQSPCLVYSDSYVYDNKNKKIKNNTLYPFNIDRFEDFIFHNGGYQGCSILFNRCLMEIALSYEPKKIHLHDETISLIAHTFGKVYAIKKPLMIYRVHDNNVIAKNTNEENLFFRRFKQIFLRNAYVIKKDSFLSKIDFYENFKDEISENNKVIYNNYFLYLNSKFFNRLIIALSEDITMFRCYLFYNTLTKKLYDR
jgi:rhamnosyltransferase